MAFYTLCGPFSDVESAEFRSAARIYDYYYNSVEFINGTPYDRSRNNFYKDIPVFYDNEFYVPLKYLFDDKHFWEHFKTMSFARNEYMDSLLACGINPDLLPDELNDLNEHSQANAIIAAYMLHPYNQQDQDWYNMLTRLRLIHKVFGSDFEILSESE